MISPLASTAAYHLPLLAEQEFSVAASKTYTAQLTVIAMLGSRASGRPSNENRAARLARARGGNPALVARYFRLGGALS